MRARAGQGECARRRRLGTTSLGASTSPPAMANAKRSAEEMLMKALPIVSVLMTVVETASGRSIVPDPIEDPENGVANVALAAALAASRSSSLELASGCDDIR